MIKKKRGYNLIKIIYNDLCIYGNIQLLLLIIVMISAMSVIIVTYHTRCMIFDHEQLLLQKKNLYLEYNNLILERNRLSDHLRIERIAINKLQMCYTDIKLEKKVFH